MKFPNLLSLVALYIGGTVMAAEVIDYIESSECYPCVEQVPDLVTCSVDNGCDVGACLSASDGTTEGTLAAMDGCCDACSEQWETTVQCFVDCLPACIENTTVTYYSCVSFVPYNCTTGCEEEWTTFATTTGDELTSDAESGELDFSILEGKTVEDATCTNIEADFKDQVCGLADCCPYCIDEFELVAECLVNTAILREIFGKTEECDVECGTNKKIINIDDIPDTPNNLPGNRKLQGDLPFVDPPPGGGATGGLPPYMNGELPPPIQKLLQQCRTSMAAQLAVDQTGAPLDAYMECIMSVTLSPNVDNGGEPSAGTDPGESSATSPRSFFSLLGATGIVSFATIAIFG